MKSVILICCSLFFTLARAQQKQFIHGPSTGKEKMAAFEKQKKLAAESPYKKLRWRNVGPDSVSGRCTEVAGIPGNRAIIYAAFATGGFWKTTDTGKTWKPLFDREGTQSIGTFSIAHSDSNVIYLGTGESNIFRASLTGMGIYKSKDGGATWKHVGLENTGTIARIVINPLNPNTVYVAASGNEWTYNKDRGVFKTTDGGKSWKKILGRDDKEGCIDLLMDPADTSALIASTWNRIRRKWSDPVPEDGDHIYRTMDGGKTWEPRTIGVPDTKFTGRIGLAFITDYPNVKIVYAFVDNHTPLRDPKSGELDPYGRPIQVVPTGVEVYRSDDFAQSFRKVSTENEKLERFCGTYGWVFGQIRVDPNEPKNVFILGVSLAKSVDMGRTFTILKPNDSTSDHIHGDHHALWIDPQNSDYLINGNDGGVMVSYDGGRNWKNFFSKIPTTQFYNLTYDNKVPYNVFGSVQDEGTLMGSIRNQYGTKDTTITKWHFVPGGEGTIIAVDPRDPDIIYSSSFYGRLMRSDLRIKDSTRTTKIAPQKAEDEDIHRGQWLAYTLLSPHDPKTIYHGFQYLFKSTDQGKNWKRISPDLSSGDTSALGKTPYAISFQSITAIDESPLARGLLYVGTDDGRVWMSPDDGQQWIPIVNGLPKSVHVSRLVAGKFKTGTIYLSMSDRTSDNIRPYLYRSIDSGRTWVSIASNLPAAPVNVIREDPANPSILYCGTDMGVYVSGDEGKTWRSLQANLPASVSVQDLFIHPREHNLAIATYGRGVWVLDDLSMIRAGK